MFSRFRKRRDPRRGVNPWTAAMEGCKPWRSGIKRRLNAAGTGIKTRCSTLPRLVKLLGIKSVKPLEKPEFAEVIRAAEIPPTTTKRDSVSLCERVCELSHFRRSCVSESKSSVTGGGVCSSRSDTLLLGSFLLKVVTSSLEEPEGSSL
ncbi:hypothetical protein ROHU_019217 [Labeo rohita]|uniref:Uncharacterized protein n=1 Tax=Labeo rohita TaxID=84645 RepID=A0A498NCA6_LABRO|nr:hypothetical protein ROHU_019217 [Labeo rohita]